MATKEPECLFCKIAGKKIPSYVIYEDDRALAFLDIEPRSPGHTLVVPKFHAVDLLALPDREVGPFFSAVKKISELLTKALEPDGMTIGVNQGEASGQVVGHLHVHLLPRFSGDGGGAIQSAVHNRPKISLEEMQKKILRNK